MRMEFKLVQLCVNLCLLSGGGDVWGGRLLGGSVSH
jgi:hypothetical protein